jgi:hypothetical protein
LFIIKNYIIHPLPSPFPLEGEGCLPAVGRGGGVEMLE